TVGNGLLHLVFLTSNSLLSAIFIHSTKKRADLHTFRYFVYTLKAPHGAYFIPNPSITATAD
ncbi:hypothetical protein, partial [Brevibacillus laterosporus]|uniref:hypothetical protein n=1 Tax=Brevibacillus laterosporus TaxID=1465 RepID=UPI00197C83C8